MLGRDAHWLTLCLLVAVACERGQSTPTAAGDSPSPTTPLASVSSVAPSLESRPVTSVPRASTALAQPSESEVRAASIAFLQDWVRAQNSRDAKRYRAAYHPKEFTGLKRGHKGQLTRFDYEGWMKDRLAMFEAPFEVAADAPLVETWLDLGSTLRNGISKLSFTQRWRSARYEDHGPKALLLWRNAQTGVQQIVFEEMLTANPGWEPAPGLTAAAPSSSGSASALPQSPQSPPAPSTNGGAAPVPAKVKFDFSQGLGSVGLTMSNAEAIAQASLVTPQLGAFAQALLRFGPLDCLSHIQYEQCGEVAEDWNAVDKALVDHACVRRAALLPILQSRLLGPSEIVAMQSELLKIPALMPVDAPMIKALATTLQRLPRAASLPFAKVASEQKQQDPAFLDLYERLEPSVALQLASTSGHPEVATPVDSRLHAVALHRLHTSGTRLATEKMAQVIEGLFGAQQSQLLEVLVADEECQLAMLAANALARLGQTQHLPTWASVKTEQEAWRAICLLRHDPDAARQKTELAKFFNPSRPAAHLVLLAIYPGWESEAEELNAKLAKQSAAEKALVEEISRLFELGGGGFQEATKTELSAADVQVLIDAPGFDTDGLTSRSGRVAFFEHEGHFFLRHVAEYTYEHHGCPC